MKPRILISAATGQEPALPELLKQQHALVSRFCLVIEGSLAPHRLTTRTVASREEWQAQLFEESSQAFSQMHGVQNEQRGIILHLSVAATRRWGSWALSAWLASPEQNSGHTTGEKAVTEFWYPETLTYSPPYWLASAQRWGGFRLNLWLNRSANLS